MHATTIQEFEITLKDLRFVSTKCANCQTVITLDMERKTEISPKSRESSFFLTIFPVCGRAYDSSLPGSINSIHAAYQAVPERLRDLIAFRAKADSEKT